ncbi:MAG: translocation protein TolB, partial [Comamonadaceae bacterium CG17_big_fil_post_rev_8_21_14_2_50_60_13]
MIRFLVTRYLWMVLVFLPGLVHAQFRVEVSGVGLTQLPISFAPFKGQDASP